MEAAVRRLFDRYERFFMRALGGDLDESEAASLYAAEFIAATPAGVTSGKNDDAFLAAMGIRQRSTLTLASNGWRIGLICSISRRLRGCRFG